MQEGLLWRCVSESHQPGMPLKALEMDESVRRVQRSQGESWGTQSQKSDTQQLGREGEILEVARVEREKMEESDVMESILRRSE